MRNRMQLGVIATRLLAQWDAEDFAHEDANAFGAPSEIHRDISRSQDREWQQLADDLEAEHGCSIQEIEIEFEARVRKYWLYAHGIYYALERIDQARNRAAYEFEARMP